MNETNQITATAKPEDRLAQLKQRYAPADTAREGAYKSFDRASQVQSGLSARLSNAPQTESGKGIDTATLYKDMAGIQMDLAELTEQYGKLNVNFQSVMGKNKFLTYTDVAKVLAYNLILQKQKARQVKLDAAGRKGETLVFLVDRMGEVLGDQHQKAVKGREYAQQVQLENVAHAKLMDRTFVERLGASYIGTSDIEEATAELVKLENELNEIDGVLVEYEGKVQQAKVAKDVNEVKRLTGEMTEVLNMKEGVLDGRLSAEGIVSDIRRDFLKSAEGIQSAKGAIAATKVNYQATTLWIDAMNELVFKYEHALHDFVPVFQAQAKIAAGGLEALAMKEALLKASQLSQRLMEANEKLVTKLTSEVFDLVKTPLYDPIKAKAVEDRLKEYATQLNDSKKQWAEAQQSVAESVSQPHYAKRT